jgi:drug/metabolite transporter (DMT)-like permease
MNTVSTLPVPTTRAIPVAVLLALAATWLIWGSTYLAIKVALTGIAPFLQMGSRFLLAGALLLAFLLIRGAMLPTWQQWRNALVIGGLMLGGGMGAVGVAEQSISSGLAATLVAAMPVMLLVWGFVFERAVPKRLEVGGILLGLVGVVMLTRGTGLSASPTGTLAMLTAILCWSLGTVLSRRHFKLADGAMGFASEMLAGGALLMLGSVLLGEPWHWPIHAEALAAWVYLVVAGSLIGFSAYMFLLDRVAPALGTSYAYVNPVVALAVGVALGGERVTGWELLSVMVILAAVGLITVAQRRG